MPNDNEKPILLTAENIKIEITEYAGLLMTISGPEDATAFVISVAQDMDEICKAGKRSKLRLVTD